jgi:ATP-dependent DNA helicase RecQ
VSGASSAKVKARRHDHLACHGSLARHELRSLRAWLDQLLAQGFLVHGPYAELRLTRAGRDLLEGRGDARLSAPPAQGRRARSPAATAGEPTPDETRLFEALRAWRIDQARQRNWPAYLVFSDVTLRELCRARPRSLAALARVRGIGEQKLAQFGPALLAFLLDQPDAI